MTQVRLAFVVSHPIQYYAPLHQRLARRNDVAIKVFFTWHDGKTAVRDMGFGRPVSWDIPLTDGYQQELVPNVSGNPGTHHFLGLRNPELVSRVLAWRPDAVHVTGWAWTSHLQVLHAMYRRGIPTLFRGDSHLLNDPRTGPRWMLKQALLKRVFSWPSAFLYVGTANREYFEAFGASQERLHYCPHCIDVERFAGSPAADEDEAKQWRREIGIGDDRLVVLFAGKFEPTKQPLELMRAVLSLTDPGPVLILVGDGVLDVGVRQLANSHPSRFRVLPFQNQRRMPIVYRLGDLFVLPSRGDTWGLAVNEALACGRPALVSDRAGCALDVFRRPSEETVPCGEVFQWNDESAMIDAIRRWIHLARGPNVRKAALARAYDFDVVVTETSVIDSLRRILG